MYFSHSTNRNDFAFYIIVTWKSFFLSLGEFSQVTSEDSWNQREIPVVPGWVTLILTINQAESGCSENLKTNSLNIFDKDHKELTCT